MVKVVGRSEAAVYTATCENCASILEFVKNEVTTQFYKERDGSSDSYKFVKCPECGIKVNLSDDLRKHQKASQ